MTQHLDQYKSLETLSVLALVCLILGLLFSVIFLLYLSLILLVVGVFFRKTALIIASCWMKFALVIGAFNAKILLSLAFFFFLLPISVVYRLVKGDTLGIKRQSCSSYWKDINRSYSMRDFEKQW